MGYYLEVVSPTGERKEGKLIVSLVEAGAKVKDDAESGDQPDVSGLDSEDIPEYPSFIWKGDFFYKVVIITIPPVTDDKKHRQHIAWIRLSWATEAGAYAQFLQDMLKICDPLGLELVDGQVYDEQPFGRIMNENIPSAVQFNARCSSVICNLLGVVRERNAGPSPNKTSRRLPRNRAIPI